LLRSFHLQTPIGVVPVEGFVSVGTRIGTLRDTAESIEIELALKGRQLGVAEIAGQNVRHEQIRVPYHEGVALWKPTNDVGVLLAEHFHEFSRKWIGRRRT
jgi:hypothetical protein